MLRLLRNRAAGTSGGAGGIRTLDTVLPYTHFPGERLRPLGHRSAPNPIVPRIARGVNRVRNQFALEGGRSSRAPASGQGVVMEREGLDALRAPVSAAL